MSYHQKKKTLVNINKLNSQAQLPVLNWNNQNPNLTTVEMSMLIIQ